MPVPSLRARMIRGVSWKNPLVNAVVHTLDPVDFAIRVAKRRKNLPPFSIRVRSNGVRQDIGAAGFVSVGRYIAELLSRYALLKPDSAVLEIGCGCGRSAIALSKILADGNYTGMDIERVALEAARSNPLLRKKGFRFDFLDVRNEAYNPNGKFSASEYILPYAEASFDIVYMTSVFTHMLTDEVRNYATQIARVLRPGGRCFTTAYLLDRSMAKRFPYSAQEHSFENKDIPEIAVAYRSAFLEKTFAEKGMNLLKGPLWGTIHGERADTELDQDLLVFQKALC